MPQAGWALHEIIQESIPFWFRGTTTDMFLEAPNNIVPTFVKVTSSKLYIHGIVFHLLGTWRHI